MFPSCVRLILLLGFTLNTISDCCLIDCLQNGGHCQPKLFGHPQHISRFELRNFRKLKELVEKYDIDCEWRTLSSVRGFMSHDMFRVAKEDVEETKRRNPHLGKMIQIVSAGDNNPSLEDLQLGKDAVGALIQQNSASLWPYKLIAWIFEEILRRNCSGDAAKFSFNLQTNTPAMRLQNMEDGSWIVHTERGMIAAKKVLLATNAYTAHLLPEFKDLIVPVRGQMTALLPPSSLRPDSGKPLTGIHSYGFLGNRKQHSNQDDYLIQRPFSVKDGQVVGGELMFGGGRGSAAGLGMDVADDTAIDEPVSQYLRYELNSVLDLQNEGKYLAATYEWSGIMGFSRDGNPWVGPVSEELGGGQGLFICAGFTGHGMPNASICAELVVHFMTTDKPTQQLEVKDRNIPPEFLVSYERAAYAKSTYPEVQMVDLLPDDFHC
jgi:glycine/D-amino acid oxidase-like deaminating enzyme